MIKVDWSKGPEDSTIAYLRAYGNKAASVPMYYKFINGKPFFYGSAGDWGSSAHPTELIMSGGDENYKFIPKVKPRLKVKGNTYFAGSIMPESSIPLANRFLAEVGVDYFNRGEQ